ncbi:alpha/beta hydrolase [Nonomuraea sp. NPDC004580]|uniref:alpha/beta fold hydrolase n=1 Tax=Nonomuraea sp. NPDC004580 TaxID=3154552 RepID=UPI0033A2F694
MIRTFKTTAVAALCAAVVGVGAAGCNADGLDELDKLDALDATPSTSQEAGEKLLSGTEKIDVAGVKVNVSCAGEAAEGKPVIMLLAGAGDGLDKLAALQKTLSAKNRVCSYDRPGEGASDKPKGPQTFESAGEVLTAVLDKAAGDHPVVLAGHSLGGLIAARYAPEHTDKVKGVVLMDATPSTMLSDMEKSIPANAKGPAGELRAQNLAVFKGQNPEMMSMPDGPVASAGDIPVEVLKHGKEYLAALPTYGPKLEQAWTAGQRAWLKLSSDSKLIVADKSEHYIYVDQPELAVESIERVAAQAAGDQPAQ